MKPISERVLRICEEYRRATAIGEKPGDIVARLAARNNVQRPAIWRNLRTGGVLPPYAPKQSGGSGRPRGGGESGWTERRRETSSRHRKNAEIFNEARRAPDREPCSFCGVRGDIGCSHKRATS